MFYLKSILQLTAIFLTMLLGGCTVYFTQAKVEDVEDPIESTAVFVDNQCLNTYFVGGDHWDRRYYDQAVTLQNQALDKYGLIPTQTEQEADFKLTFECQRYNAYPKRGSLSDFKTIMGGFTLFLVPMFQDYPDRMGLKVYDLRAGQAELVDQNNQYGHTESAVWWMPAILVTLGQAIWETFSGNSAQVESYAEAIGSGVDSLLSQAINDYVFE